MFVVTASIGWEISERTKRKYRTDYMVVVIRSVGLKLQQCGIIYCVQKEKLYWVLST